VIALTAQLLGADSEIGAWGRKSSPGTHPNQNVARLTVLELEFVNVIE